MSLFEPATPFSPVYSTLIIQNPEQPFRCNSSVPITIKYYIIGETANNYHIDLIYMVSSNNTTHAKVLLIRQNITTIFDPSDCDVLCIRRSFFRTFNQSLQTIKTSRAVFRFYLKEL